MKGFVLALYEYNSFSKINYFLITAFVRVLIEQNVQAVYPCNNIAKLWEHIKFMPL